ncbi:hypothetical protein BU16DRAFT_199652 [Lophium mytilinum]|uniref:Uncharacterized protein n=1 Tax=Lophium mytilinum TaxID=390894 RepID=A0A6A6R9E6_9PEZI|nr:hypothetical protein BU16DRAFT_199652 [Lophium mytilinum]
MHLAQCTLCLSRRGPLQSRTWAAAATMMPPLDHTVVTLSDVQARSPRSSSLPWCSALPPAAALTARARASSLAVCPLAPVRPFSNSKASSPLPTRIRFGTNPPTASCQLFIEPPATLCIPLSILLSHASALFPVFFHYCPLHLLFRSRPSVISQSFLLSTWRRLSELRYFRVLAAMSLTWITERINDTLHRFSNNVENFKQRSESVAQAQQRRINLLEQRVSNLEKLLSERHLADQRKDSAEPQLSTRAGSSSAASSLHAARYEESAVADPLILPSFDERSRGVDPMDMSFKPLSPDEGPSEAWRKDWERLSCRDGYSNPDSMGEYSDGDEEMLASPAPPHTNGQGHHHSHSGHDYNPNTWS